MRGIVTYVLNSCIISAVVGVGASLLVRTTHRYANKYLEYIYVTSRISCHCIVVKICACIVSTAVPIMHVLILKVIIRTCVEFYKVCTCVVGTEIIKLSRD